MPRGTAAAVPHARTSSRRVFKISTRQDRAREKEEKRHNESEYGAQEDKVEQSNAFLNLRGTLTQLYIASHPIIVLQNRKRVLTSAAVQMRYNSCMSTLESPPLIHIPNTLPRALLLF